MGIKKLILVIIVREIKMQIMNYKRFEYLSKLAEDIFEKVEKIDFNTPITNGRNKEDFVRDIQEAKKYVTEIKKKGFPSATKLFSGLVFVSGGIEKMLNFANHCSFQYSCFPTGN